MKVELKMSWELKTGNQNFDTTDMDETLQSSAVELRWTSECQLELPASWLANNNFNVC